MATYSITTLLENAGLTENVEAQIELEMLDDDGDGILSEDQYEAAQKILRDHERFAQSFDGEKERATALRSAGQRFAPSASTAMSQAAAKNGEPVDYASPDLDPFYNRRTEEELGAILADPDAFRQYVIAQGLEAAFLDENDDLVYDGMTVAEFYEILGSVYDETGEVKTSTSQVEIPDFSFSRIQRDKPWFDVNMPSEEFAAAFREAFTAESPNAVAEEDISLLVEAMDRLDGRFDGVIAELDLGAGQVAAYLVSGFTKGYTMADMFSLLGNPENLSPAQQKNHAEIADGCQQALIQLQEAGLMSVRVPWNQQTDWRWQILGVLGEEMAAGASGYSGAAFNVDQAFTDLAGIMEMADARGVSFGEAYQAYTDYGEATRQNRLTRQEWLESAWREFPQEGGNRLPLSDNRVEVDVKPSNIGLLLHAVGKKDPKAAESALKNLPVVEIDGPGAEIRCYQPRNFESTGPTPYLIVQSDEHAFKINGQVYSNPGIYVFNSEGRYQFALADKSRDLSFEDGPETALINSENNLAMFTAGRLMAEADLSRIRGDQAAYEKSMLALGSEFRKFSSYGAAEAGYQTIMDPLGVNSSAARTALADMKGKGTYDLADHTKDVLTREAVTAVALMVGAGEVGLVSRFVGEAGLTFLARRMLVDTTAKRVMARILTSKVTQQASGSLFMAYGLNGTLAAIEYGRTGKTGYDGIGDFMKQGVRLATEMGIAGGVGRGVTKLAGGGAGLLGESAAFTGIGAGFSQTETFRKRGETPVGWGELDFKHGHRWKI
ncbi:MAG: hypothetical protein HYU99_05340 [Deltaproteobacteria bacterium]|nr:hypothetical protein [Deltaproteobacteria bacterium]